MIRNVVDSINSLYSLTFEDVVLGVVHPHDNKGMLIPASSDGTAYPDAIPDSSRKSIMYWEDYGATTWRRTARYRFVEHRLRLVVWLNFDRIEESYEECIRQIHANLPRKIGNVLVEVTGQVPKSTDIFSRYDYQERKQYITYPYDVVALEVTVKYPEVKCPVPMDIDEDVSE